PTINVPCCPAEIITQNASCKAGTLITGPKPTAGETAPCTRRTDRPACGSRSPLRASVRNAGANSREKAKRPIRPKTCNALRGATPVASVAGPPKLSSDERRSVFASITNEAEQAEKSLYAGDEAATA